MESVQLNGFHWCIQENSAVGRHAGEAENTVIQVKGLVWTLKDAVEEKYGMMEDDHPARGG